MRTRFVIPYPANEIKKRTRAVTPLPLVKAGFGDVANIIHCKSQQKTQTSQTKCGLTARKIWKNLVIFISVKTIKNTVNKCKSLITITTNI